MRRLAGPLLSALVVTAVIATAPGPAASAGVADVVAGADVITTETQLRAAWADPRRTKLEIGANIVLRDCEAGDPIRETAYPVLVEGNDHSIRQTCFEQRLLRQDSTGYILLRGLTLSRGGSDGPGAAVTTRGEIRVESSVIRQNLAEEPGGGIFSMRGATIVDSVMTGNLANDDGGAVYARRGGVRVYDSTLSNNLVDGSGGAIGSTGDVVVVRSHVDGNTTDGDGGAIYTDEDGDVTVVDSTVDGSDADGPGGAIFTLDGDVAIYGSTLIGNRADDRGGAISGEADVLLVNTTLARNFASAHVGGAVWSRGDMTLVGSTVADNYAEGQGGGVLAAGRLSVVSSTVSSNSASSAANLASGHGLVMFGSIIGPAGTRGGMVPTTRNCVSGETTGSTYNVVTDQSCKLDDPTNVVGVGDLQIDGLELDPDSRMLVPRPGSPVLDVIPEADCHPVIAAPEAPDFLLSQHVDWRAAASMDGAGRVRPQGTACDVGAAEPGSDR
ncbi:hypothetical protein [Aeromicrobium yanjiei]|uniref:Right handed beta helix domain-containing protein n=1 Tax=Aeromicrobium yanjiei TaxID=2662028 RepID=A0A5Q2MN33_9ACTN|nr:hypothetical protein [Aeromicrobium yanjiei]QGG41380.1 hypothetical protein GEV26_08405 [Aeromicrobium yanjiei]